MEDRVLSAERDITDLRIGQGRTDERMQSLEKAMDSLKASVDKLTLVMNEQAGERKFGRFLLHSFSALAAAVIGFVADHLYFSK